MVAIIAFAFDVHRINEILNQSIIFAFAVRVQKNEIMKVLARHVLSTCYWAPARSVHTQIQSTGTVIA